MASMPRWSRMAYLGPWTTDQDIVSRETGAGLSRYLEALFIGWGSGILRGLRYVIRNFENCSWSVENRILGVNRATAGHLGGSAWFSVNLVLTWIQGKGPMTLAARIIKNRNRYALNACLPCVDTVDNLAALSYVEGVDGMDR